MIIPILQETDVFRQGASYIRRLNTGTLDTTNMTPRPTLQNLVTKAEVPTAFQMARLTADGYDPRYDWAVVVARSVTSQLDAESDYFANFDFDDADGLTTIPIATVEYTVAPGVKRT